MAGFGLCQAQSSWLIIKEKTMKAPILSAMLLLALVDCVGDCDKASSDGKQQTAQKTYQWKMVTTWPIFPSWWNA